jgi:hypothetical protein
MNIENNTSYKYYRLIIYKKYANASLQIKISEFKLLGTTNSLFYNRNEINNLLHNTTEKQIFPASIVQNFDKKINSNVLFNIVPSSYIYENLQVDNSYNYFIYSSSSNSASKAELFDNSSTTFSSWLLNTYSTSSPFLYTGSSYISDSTYKGEWIIIKFPYSFILTKFVFVASSTSPNNAPAKWRCYGSIDGAIWNEIMRSSSDKYAEYGVNYFSSRFQVDVGTNYMPYAYIGWVFNGIVGSAGQLLFNGLEIYGRVDVGTAYLNTWTTNYNKTYNLLGNVGIGTTNPTAALHVVGEILATQDITAFSDKRLKENIIKLDNVENVFNSISGYSFNWNKKGQELLNKSFDEVEIGLIAQEVQDVIPSAISSTKNNNETENYLTLKYTKLIPYLVEGYKLLNDKYNKQQEQINEIKQLLQK